MSAPNSPLPPSSGGKVFTPESLVRMLARMASAALGAITLRAFPAGGTAGHSVDGSAFPPLSKRYREYKSGTYPYKSPATRARAMAARRNPKGTGPLVNELGTKRRLAPRSTAPDQRLTNLTSQALGVVSGPTPSEVVIGFRDTRSRELFPHLQHRNHFWPLSPAEEALVQSFALETLGEAFGRLRTDGVVIRVEIKPGT